MTDTTQGEGESQGLCDTTQTERFSNPDCKCKTYEGNLGPCRTFQAGDNERCAYCDHELTCHSTAQGKVDAWQPMETAPKDRQIEGLYEGEPDLIEWRDDRYCMLGRRAGSYPPGWVGIESGYLPQDPPEMWREARP